MNNQLMRYLEKYHTRMDINKWVDLYVWKTSIKMNLPKVVKKPNPKSKKRHMLKHYGNCGARTNLTVWKNSNCIGCLSKMLKAIKKINAEAQNIQDSYWIDCEKLLEEMIQKERFNNQFKDVVNEEV